MNRPKYDQYKYAKRSLLPRAFLDSQEKYIDQLEDEIKEMKEAFVKIETLTDFAVNLISKK